MSNDKKVKAIVDLIIEKTIPKDQFGFYGVDDIIRDVEAIIYS